VQQHHRLSLSALYVVQPYAVNLDEVSGGRIVTFGLPGPELDEHCHGSECCANTEQYGSRPQAALPDVLFGLLFMAVNIVCRGIVHGLRLV
jgi:hypothetical protein